MRQRIAITIVLGLTAHAAYASEPTCDSVAGGDVLSVRCPEAPDSPGPTCPVTFPVPTDASVCACKTANSSTARCNNVPPSVCSQLITNALSAGLITPDAQAWMLTNGWCPILISGALTALCPNGCFDPDTQILSGVTSDGDASYTSAAQLAVHDALLTLSDEAELDAVDLVSRPISRVVHGPEESQLFAFALSNGATLRVTSHHPMVLDSGLIVEAADVVLGSAFVGIDGQPVKVTEITRVPATGDVFNFETHAESQLGQVMAAEGVLVGGLKLQNELAAEETLIALRR